MKIDRTGCTRIVILTKRYAFKIPNFIEGFRPLLNGLLANHQEVVFSKAKYEGLCPVAFYLPFGLLAVMPKVKLLTDSEFLNFDAKSFSERENYYLPIEEKSNSYGWLNGQIVGIDYGS